jgi:ADP-ribose pyrophosphatase YjhB (NUDIX family)
MVEAARRETWEEARAQVSDPQLYTIFNLPHINQVYVIYYGKLYGETFGPGPESEEVQLVTLEDIPWEKLAFATIRETLKLYVHDCNRGQLGLHSGDIIRPWVLTDSTNAQLRNLVTVDC